MIKLIINPDDLPNTLLSIKNMLVFPDHQSAISFALKNLPLYSYFEVSDNDKTIVKGRVGFGLTLPLGVHFEYK